MLSNISFDTEEMEILELGLNYAYNKPIQFFLQDLVIDTENAIKKLNTNEQEGYRLIAYKKLNTNEQEGYRLIAYKKLKGVTF